MQTGESRAERLRVSPVHRSVIGKRRILGVPMGYVVMNFSGIFSIAWFAQEWPIALLAVFNFWMLRIIFKKDASLIEIWFRYYGQAEHYEPWPHASNKDQREKLIGHQKAW